MAASILKTFENRGRNGVLRIEASILKTLIVRGVVRIGHHSLQIVA